MNKVKVGIIGCGKISSIYMENCKKFEVLDLIACADIDIERAQEKASEYQIPRVYTPEQLLADPDIQLVINLTIPAAHASVCLQALEAGKHVYVEKPLAVTREEGQRVLQVAKEKGLLVGCAPETFYGAGIQTALQLVNDGVIGKPVAATAFMMSRGHEGWHPDPEFYYQAGGGPMFDMGPYYLTALIQLLGPIKRITGITGKALDERVISSEKKRGKVIPVEIPTHVAGMMEFEAGAIGTLIMSFDIFGGSSLPPIEIYGTKGTLLVPDPNNFGGEVKYRLIGDSEWTTQPLLFGYEENTRGIAAADMAYAIQSGRPHRANGEMAYHVLEAMWAFHDASEEQKHYDMRSTCTRPNPMHKGLSPYTLDF
ncbi:Gfo/Idh/MocA family protein [Paenibacillus crassostreae]|uniref:Oxidoreductase n=1 Tax=Paenibacillus crassostreae TaxID=1763538 RepID=A0A167FIF2_9BACL|nr:Gfo/Idh/MocA family oxidoreductase [Paenibacillus crassostreae]AOZ94373.1 oxidoreductase [Paenibacillus crassostreae]OAB76590.1 oxidoreductase [Paenibacillus crassostreae]